MYIIIGLDENILSYNLIEKLLPNEKVKIDSGKKMATLSDNNNLPYELPQSSERIDDGIYYIEMATAKLKYFDNRHYNTYRNKSEGTKPNYKFNGIIVELYLSQNKRDLDCKIYNLGNYKDEVPYVYLTKNKKYKELFELAKLNSKQIVNKYSIKPENYSSHNHYLYYNKQCNNIFKERYGDKFFKFENSYNIVNYNDYNNYYTFYSIIHYNTDIIDNNLRSLTLHMDELNRYSYLHKKEEKKLLEIVDKEYNFTNIFCDKGWTGDRNVDKFLSYMTYINMHTINGLIFDDKKYLKLIDDTIVSKYTPLGVFYYITNELELKHFKEIFGIDDKDLGIGKYVVIAPNQLESFAKRYINKYITHIQPYNKNEDIEEIIKEFNIKICEKLTKLTYLHELGHMAFSKKSTGRKIVYEESAANWYASIGLDVVEKYRVYLKTRMQPKEYKNFLTNLALLPGGVLFEDIKNIDEVHRLYMGKVDINKIRGGKDSANLMYYKKVIEMIEGMYFPNV